MEEVKIVPAASPRVLTEGPSDQGYYERRITMPNDKAVAIIDDKQIAIQELETRFALAVRQRELLEKYIRERLKPDKHFYSVDEDPARKPSLSKEGAELICLPHNLKPQYELLSGPEQPPLDDSPYQLTMRCELRRGAFFEGQGIGSASSMITKKDGQRVARQKDPGLRHNATLKMACKSAYIAATLNSTAASEFFTQDLEDDQSGFKEPWCQKHNTSFFMRGKMKSYAHPVKDAQGNDTGEWCHKHKEKSASSAETKPVPADAPAQAGSDAPTDLTTLEFKDAGEFKTTCLKYFKLQGSQRDKEVSGYDLANPIQRKQAWEHIVSIYGQKESEI